MSHCKIGFFRWSRLKNHSYNTISSHFTVGVCLTAMHTVTEYQKWLMNCLDFNGPNNTVCCIMAGFRPPYVNVNCRSLIITIFSPFYGDSNSFIDSWLNVQRNIHICKETFMCVKKSQWALKGWVFCSSTLQKMMGQKSSPFSINQSRKKRHLSFSFFQLPTK